MNTEPRPNLRDKRQELGDRDYVYWCLGGSYTAQGREAWWNRQRYILGGISPIEAWKIDTDHRELVILLAERLL